jgi:hypothetical protein
LAIAAAASLQRGACIGSSTSRADLDVAASSSLGNARRLLAINLQARTSNVFSVEAGLTVAAIFH